MWYLNGVIREIEEGRAHFVQESVNELKDACNKAPGKAGVSENTPKDPNHTPE